MDHADLLTELDLRFAPHVARLQERMDRFRPSRFESWNKDDLSRYFVHLWLRLVDQKILDAIDNDGVYVEEGVNDGR